MQQILLISAPMRVDETTWHELKAARARVDSWAQFAGLLHVNEKTAKSWVEDRSRDVRPKKLAFALAHLRASTRSSIKTDTESAESTRTNSAIASYPAAPALPTASRQTDDEEGRTMVLTDDEAYLVMTLRNYGIAKAREELDRQAGAQSKARSRLQRRSAKKR